MGRLNYDFDNKPLETTRPSPAMRRVRIIAIFCTVALVTGGLLYILIPHPKGEEAQQTPPPPEKQTEQTAENLPLPVEQTPSPSPGKSAETPTAAAENKTDAENSPAEEQEQSPGETPETAGSGKKDPSPADPYGKGVVLPSDPPASQDQPVREGTPAADLDALKMQAASGDLSALLQAFDAAAPGSQAKSQYGLALGAMRVQSWQNGHWKKDALIHRVAAGNNLTKLASRHHTTIEFIRYANKLKNNNIRIGQNLALLPGPWAVEIGKKARLLTVYQIKGDSRIPYGSFEIGIGRAGRTPKGDFVISYRLRHPDWHTADGRVIPYGDKENVLGDYFLKLAVKGKADRPLLGYGIHGTNDETTVGRSLSNGCIRMRKDEVEMLYYLLPTGTPVTITE